MDSGGIYLTQAAPDQESNKADVRFGAGSGRAWRVSAAAAAVRRRRGPAADHASDPSRATEPSSPASRHCVRRRFPPGDFDDALSLLGRREETKPIELERRISTDPAFYTQLIRAIYRSERERDKPKREPSESERAIAANAWRLLHEWKRVPGEDGQGHLEAKAFKDWVEVMKQLANESGHLSVAMIQFGEVLIHAPADPNGLWIGRAVAAVLNGKDAEKMRQGFSTGIFNSRGAHWVDPSGEPEKKLAEQFRIKGEAVENAGFHRLAVTMRQLAESYEREAQRVIAEHRDGE